MFSHNQTDDQRRKSNNNNKKPLQLCGYNFAILRFASSFFSLTLSLSASNSSAIFNVHAVSSLCVCMFSFSCSEFHVSFFIFNHCVHFYAPSHQFLVACYLHIIFSCICKANHLQNIAQLSCSTLSFFMRFSVNTILYGHRFVIAFS